MTADEGFAGIDRDSPVAAQMRAMAATLPQRPTAVVVVTAHHTSSAVDMVGDGPRAPSLYYDYGGFPARTYEIHKHWQGKPAPAGLGAQVRTMLREAGVPVQEAPNTRRGWDHGVFIPMAVAFPDDPPPVLSLSLLTSLDPELHYRMGEALAPLRDQNILILASGSLTHPMGRTNGAAKSFTQWFDDTLKLEPVARAVAVRDAHKLSPAFRAVHSPSEHWVPWIVGAAAASKHDALGKPRELSNGWWQDLAVHSYALQ